MLMIEQSQLVVDSKLVSLDKISTVKVLSKLKGSSLATVSRLARSMPHLSKDETDKTERHWIRDAWHTFLLFFW